MLETVQYPFRYKQTGLPPPIRVETAARMADPTDSRNTALAGHPLLAGYEPAPGLFDELGSASEVQAHYLDLLSVLESLSADELRRRVDTVRRLVEEQGITYNVYGDPRGLDRPWEIDPVPFLLAPEDWRQLEAGVIQRAQLLNCILADCYGPQELIRSGGLPPALVFAQCGFLRPCHGIPAPQGIHLGFYAVDLARSPDGRWMVLSDRTQNPSGAGYALANRLVVSRSLPEAFRTVYVHRLAGFFRVLQASLRDLARRRTENPRVVLLTPGPHNETYFEQAYLARYLGYTLVEGQDLTVRDDHVFLKTLSGLEPVDVIFRRVDDEFCDPLELRNDSLLGVPGLLGALRAGTVAITNTPGSGLLQSPAFMPFLPGLCQHLLGEELSIPSLPTWWCGQADAREHVLRHLDRLVVEPAFQPGRRADKPQHPRTSEEQQALGKRIGFQPELYVAQESIRLSTSPAWSKGGLAPKPVALRVFLFASEGGYEVMPGGLVRIAAEGEWHSLLIQQGASTKDAWVMSHEPVTEVSLLHSAQQNLELRRTANNLPSRLADCFFWLGRYSERADNTARLLRSALLRLNPGRYGVPLTLLTPLLQVLEAQGQLPAGTVSTGSVAQSDQLEAALHAVIFDRSHPGSLRRLAAETQRLGMHVRDRTSNDMWRALSQIDDHLGPGEGGEIDPRTDAVSVLNRMILHLAALQGLTRENMTRGQGWRFKDIGHRIERSIYIALLLERTLQLPEADNPSLLEILLESADSSITHRSRYNLLPTLAAVYDLILLDETNPRSLLFQVLQLVKHFERLPRERTSVLPGEGERLLIGCCARLRLLDTRELGRLQGGWHESETALALQAVLRDLPRLSDAIAASYFAHSEIARAGGAASP